MLKDSDLFQIGVVQKIHGVKGKVELAYSDDVFVRTDYEWLFFRIDGLLTPFRLETASLKGNNRALLQLEGIDNTEKAQIFLGSECWFPKDEVPEREDIPDTWDFLAGFEISDINCGRIGMVESVNTQSANVILFVKNEKGKEVMIPMHPDLCVEFNEKKRTVLMQLPKGLLELN